MIFINVFFIMIFCNSAYAMNRSFTNIVKDFDGKIGIHAINLATKQEISERADELFPMASTRKVVLASYILDLIDKNRYLTLDQIIDVEKKDVVPGTGVIKDHFYEDDVFCRYDIHRLLNAMIMHSDNTAADVLMKLGGGHEAVDAWIKDNKIDNIYFGIDIRSWLKSQVAKTLFYQEAQQTIITNKQAPLFLKGIAYLASWFPQPNSIDFSDEGTNIATPRAMNQFLAHCYQGTGPGLSNEKHKKLLLGLMSACQTGSDRIPKYMPQNSVVMHKTGSGIVGICNDVGIVESPDKAPIVMTIFVKDSIKPMRELEEVIAGVAKVVHDSL